MVVARPLPRLKIKELRLVEEKGRDLVSRGSELVGSDDIEWFDDVDRGLGTLRDAVPRAGTLVSKLSAALSRVKADAMYCYDRAEDRRSCRLSPPARASIREADAEASRILGRGCALSLGERDYTLASAISDITSCYKNLVDVVEKASEGFRFENRCAVASDADPRLASSCKLFDETSKQLMKRYGFYPRGIYERISCVVKGGRKECTLDLYEKGAIDLDRDTIEIYTDDERVKSIMSKIYRDMGMGCAHTREGIACVGVTRRLSEASKAMACITDMTFRRLDLGGKALERHIERHPEYRTLIEKCKAGDRIDHACTCKLAIETIGRAG